jgi:hypothetical protein
MVMKKNTNIKLPNPLKEALKAVLRIILLTIVASIITSNVPFFDFQRDAGWMIFLLIFFDKWLHIFGKNHNNPKLAKGLTRF